MIKSLYRGLLRKCLPVMGILEPPGRLAKSWFALPAAADMFAGTCATVTRHARLGLHPKP
jgi:hypothetical protein